MNSTFTNHYSIFTNAKIGILQKTTSLYAALWYNVRT